jgi:uncharacterized OB-fold protein
MTSRFNQFPGTPLSEGDFKEGKILYYQDQMKGDFAWDTGIAIGSYLAALKEGYLLGGYCQTCRKTVIPPRTVCEWCFRPMDSYVRLEDTGTVNTFSLCYVTWDVKRIQEPELPAVIEIDGASPLHGIMHKLLAAVTLRAWLGRSSSEQSKMKERSWERIVQIVTSPTSRGGSSASAAWLN